MQDVKTEPDCQATTVRIKIPNEYAKQWDRLQYGTKTTLLTNIITRLLKVSQNDDLLIPLIMAGKENRWTFLTQ
jgi:hypothetical protein